MIRSMLPGPTRLIFVLLLLGTMAAISQAMAQTRVIVYPAVTGTIEDRIEALGTLRANESAALTASITETISEIRFQDGQRVSEGDVLVAMTNREQLAELEAAEAEFREAQSQFERVQELARQGTESATVLDLRRRELDTARARLRQVEARLADRLVTAPFDGVVGLRNVSRGTLVSPGTVITVIVDDSIMKLDFAVPELFLSVLAHGIPVSARSRAWPDATFEGVITSIDNRVDPVTRAIQVRAEIPNENRQLRPGMLLTLELMANRRDSVIIPEEAIISLGREHYLFVTDGHEGEVRAERRKVHIGTRRPGEVEIVEGLDAGEFVIIHGAFQLSNGDTVRVHAVADGETPLSEYLARGD